jgi:hypothetical protein
MSNAVLTKYPTRFPLGETVITANALSKIGTEAAVQGLNRHASGDWGELWPEDVSSNEHALRHGGRLMSVYGEGEQRFWVITECDHSVTTVLMPEDY